MPGIEVTLTYIIGEFQIFQKESTIDLSASHGFGGVGVKSYARNLESEVLPDIKEILTILFSFLRPRLSTVEILIKTLIFLDTSRFLSFHERQVGIITNHSPSIQEVNP